MVTLTGGAKLEAKLAELARKVQSPGTLRVGFLEGSTEANGTSIPMIAVTQNYGAPGRGIPPRPFFSNMITDKASGWADEIGAIFRAVDFDAKRALMLFGEKVASDLRDAIIDITDPALSPVTLLLRDRFPSGTGYTFDDVLQARRDIAAGTAVPSGHANPLVWSGTMLNSVAVELA